VKWRFSTYIREIHFANDAPPPSDSVWSVDFWFRKIIKIVARSQILRLAPNSISAGVVGSAPDPPRTAYSATSALAKPREVGGLHHFLKYGFRDLSKFA